VHIYSFLLVAGLQTRTVNQSKRAWPPDVTIVLIWYWFHITWTTRLC
jgi:hypothetical protein